MTGVLGRKRSYETVTRRTLSRQGGGNTNEEDNDGDELHFEWRVPRLIVHLRACVIGVSAVPFYK